MEENGPNKYSSGLCFWMDQATQFHSHVILFFDKYKMRLETGFMKFRDTMDSNGNKQVSQQHNTCNNWSSMVLTCFSEQQRGLSCSWGFPKDQWMHCPKENELEAEWMMMLWSELERRLLLELAGWLYTVEQGLSSVSHISEEQQRKTIQMKDNKMRWTPNSLAMDIYLRRGERGRMRRGKEAERQQERKFTLWGHTVTNSGNGHALSFRRRGACRRECGSWDRASGLAVTTTLLWVLPGWFAVVKSINFYYHPRCLGSNSNTQNPRPQLHPKTLECPTCDRTNRSVYRIRTQKA